MQNTNSGRLVTASLALPALLFVVVARSQDAPKPAPAAPSSEPVKLVFTDGQAQVVDALKKRSNWLREKVWVETGFDTDGDGRNDRMYVTLTRPKQTDTEGLKVAAIYETSPYFLGVGSSDTKYFWDPRQELGGQPKPRPEMPPIVVEGEPPMLDESPAAEVKPDRWLPRGFAVVQSCSPGTGFSQGCPTLGGDNEALAPKAVIDWLCGRAKGYTKPEGGDEVKATWCTGKVGMMGTSYNGTLPIAAATTGVDGLECIVPIAPNTSYYLYYRSNGLVRHPGGYMGEDVDVLYDFINSGDPKKRDWCTTHVREGELKKNQHRETGDLNDFWAGRDYLRLVDKMKCAMLIAHGWNDWNVMPEHSVRFFIACKQKGLPCIAYFTQGGHGGEPPLAMLNRWFSHFLYGIDNGIQNEAKSWIVRENDRNNAPTSYPDWPHPEAAPVTLYPSGGGSAVGGLASTKHADAKPEQLVDDADVKGADMAMAENSPNRLLYATPELTEPLHLSGTSKVTIRMACNKPAANLSVWVVSLPWEKRARKLTDNIVTRGWADPQNRASLRESKPLVPGEFVDVTFDLQPDDQVIAKGERLGLMIFSSDHDFTLWPPAGTELTVDLAGTSITLPVVGGAAAYAKATAPAAIDTKPASGGDEKK